MMNVYIKHIDDNTDTIGKLWSSLIAGEQMPRTGELIAWQFADDKEIKFYIVAQVLWGQYGGNVLIRLREAIR